MSSVVKAEEMFDEVDQVKYLTCSKCFASCEVDDIRLIKHLFLQSDQQNMQQKLLEYLPGLEHLKPPKSIFELDDFHIDCDVQNKKVVKQIAQEWKAEISRLKENKTYLTK